MGQLDLFGLGSQPEATPKKKVKKTTDLPGKNLEENDIANASENETLTLEVTESLQDPEFSELDSDIITDNPMTTESIGEPFVAAGSTNRSADEVDQVNKVNLEDHVIDGFVNIDAGSVDVAERNTVEQPATVLKYVDNAESATSSGESEQDIIEDIVLEDKNAEEVFTDMASAENKGEEAPDALIDTTVSSIPGDAEPLNFSSTIEESVNPIVFTDGKIGVKFKVKKLREVEPKVEVEEIEEKPLIVEKLIQKRGRKSFKEIDAEVDLIEVPEDEVLFQRQYYPISTVAGWFKVNTSLLRFWENEFDILKPRKNRKGDRMFRPEDVKNLELIYHLLREKKYTIDGAREFLKGNKKKAETQLQLTQTLQKFKSFLLELKANLQT